MRNGTVHEASVDQALGRTSAHPLPMPLLKAKFALCASTVLSSEAAAAVVDFVDRIEHQQDFRLLSKLLESTQSGN